MNLPPLSSTFLNGSNPLSFATKPTASVVAARPVGYPSVRALKPLVGKVICATNEKTVNVVVSRLAPHPKYHFRMKIKKKYQAHDPENQFLVGDMVLLEKCRPISKTKSYIAIPLPVRDTTRKNQRPKPPQELGIPLESDQVAPP